MSATERNNGEIDITREEQWRIHQLVARSRRGLQAILDRELKPMGISSVELGILDTLIMMRDAGRSSTPTDLAAKVVRRHNSVVGSLVGMERNGLVILKRNSPGRRTIEIEITSKGEQVYGDGVKATKTVAGVMCSLTPNQRQQLTNLLEKLDQAITDSLHGIS